MNPFGAIKNTAEALIHVTTGNLDKAGASTIKACVSCVPVVGSIPGVGKLIDNCLMNEHTNLTGYELKSLHNTIDVDNDGDFDIDDISEMCHNIVDFFSN
jgi:hypothetical protein